MTDLISYAKEIIDKSKSIVVLTGAGISKDSGIPTFRGEDGLWKQYSPQELANPDAFFRNPKLVWQWYNWRRELISKAKPNPGHLALHKLELIKEEFLLITQNVDGLHSKAGNRKLIEFHGNIWKEKCVQCDFKRYNEVIYKEDDLPPACPVCGSLIRPDVVWFGEAVPFENIQKSFEALRRCDTMLSVGTSGVVYPAAALVEYAVKTAKKVIEINYERTPFSDFVDVSIQERASVLLPRLVE